MRDQELDQLFDRFRRKGDVQALGAIFDATAPELLRVAMSLVREANEADDLLQETFLTAIERAERYDAERRLAPWLLGILVHHAKEQRRLRRRELDTGRFEARAAQGPEGHALGRELEQELERALGELSARERTVLEAYLRLGKGAAEIAGEIGAAPGAVRMQIHRGLDRLRKALPAGLALGAAGGALGAQGSSAVRAQVLRAGEMAAARLTVGAGSALGAAGTAGIVMGKKLMLAGVLAAFAAGLYFLRDTLGREGATDSLALERAAPARGVLEREPALVPSTAQPATRADEPSATGSRSPIPLAVDLDRAGLRGRILEHDGTPVPGLPVALVEIEETEILPERLASLGAPPRLRLLAASSITDAQGVFVLQGATVKAVHALGLDLGGERSTLRMLEVNLTPGATADLGDVVLAACGAVAGRVVDERGEGVAGARVRIGALPEFVLQLGLDGITAGGAVADLEKSGEPRYVFELPDWVSAFEARLPLATTTTRDDGSFALARVAAGRLTAVVDAPGFARLTSARFEVEAGEDSELESFALTRGQAVRGRVLDDSRKPVAGAEVRAGVAAVPVARSGGMAAFGPTRVSDAEGRFAFEHQAAEGVPVVLARRDAQAPWVPAREQGGDLVAELPAEQELVVEVVDSAGAPVRAPEFFLRRESTGELGVFAPPLQARPARVLAAEQGRFALGQLASGSYLVVARAEGAQAADSIQIDAANPPVLRLVLERLRPTEVLVFDAATRAPLGGALVRVEESSRVPQAVASARTAANGRVTLALASGGEGPLWLRVEHPRFAPQGRALEDEELLEVALTAGGRVTAHLADPSLARTSCMLQLMYGGPSGRRQEFHLPRLIGLAGKDEVVLERLAAGRWTWNLFESVSTLDPLALLGSEGRRHLAQGKFELADGETVELAIAGRGDGPRSSAGASLAGTVLVEGRPAGELHVNLIPTGGTGGNTVFTRGKGGRFRFDDVPSGRYVLMINGPLSGNVLTFHAALVKEALELSGGEQRELEYDLARLPVQLRILTAGGTAAADVKLRLLPLDEKATNDGGSGSTGSDGCASVELPASGRYLVVASHPEEGTARGELEVGERGANELTLRLSKGVPCAGTVYLEDGVSLEQDAGTLIVTSEDDGRLNMTRPLEPTEGGTPFRLVGLAPGKYSVWLWGGEETLEQSFELPELGNEALELRFTKDKPAQTR